jgi:hypothetical protein
VGLLLDLDPKKQYKTRVLQTPLVQAALLIKRPSTWLCLLIASAIWPIAILFSPLAATLSDARATSLAKELAFLSALLVLAFEERRYTQHSWMMVRLSQGRRIAHGIAARTFHACAVGMMALLPATLLGGHIGLGAYVELALSCAHLAAAYVFLSSLGLATSTRSVLVTFLAIAIPATNQGEGAAAQSVHALLDPRVFSQSNANIWLLTGVQLTSICTMAVLSTCFDSRVSR